MSDKPVGIEKLDVYTTSLSLSMETLAKARGADPAHPLEELLMEARAVNPTWEDPVTMAVNAANKLLEGEDRDAIEMCVVGSESSVDFGKPMATWVQRFAELGPRVRTFETKHACYGGTAGLMSALHWVKSGVRPGKKALVVCTDQSRMHLGKPWEYVLGAGAVAMLISDQPDVLEIDLHRNGYWTNEISDTYRPTSRDEVGHADTSLYGYLDALEGAYEAYLEQIGVESAADLDYDAHFKKNVYHVPFAKMTSLAHTTLLRKWKRMKKSVALAHWEHKTRPSLRYNSQMGGTYTGATFWALAGLIDHCEDLAAGDRISVFSYGSGSCAEYYEARIGAKAREKLAAAGIQAQLDARRPLTVPQYETIEQARWEFVDRRDFKVDQAMVGTLDGLYAEAYEGTGKLVLDGVDGWERQYRRA